MIPFSGQSELADRSLYKIKQSAKRIVYLHMINSTWDLQICTASNGLKPMDMLKNFIMCENSLASGFYIFLSAPN